MPRTITRTGRQRATLTAGVDLVADVLSDPASVTALLGDLIDQGRSDLGPPPSWVVPPIHLGLMSFETTLLPTFQRTGHEVHIEAVTTPDSDADARVVMAMAPTPSGPSSCDLVTSWRLQLAVPLPRAALRLAAPAVDRTVASTVHRIMERTEAAVLAARRS